MDPGSSSQAPQASGSSEIEAIEPETSKMNDSMFVLHKPKGMPSMQVLFFHGLQLVEDYSQAHLSTWESGDGSCIWPQKWLVEEFPGALVVSMSYSIWMGKNANKTADMYNMGENLISDILQEGIGQTLHCPVVLIGHSIGGLIIKQLCSKAHDWLNKKQGLEKDRLAALLNNVKGIFFYATPHHGSLVIKELVDIIGKPLLKYVETLSNDTERLNQEFEDTRKFYKWWVAGLGESLHTKLGPSLFVMIAPEASTRCENFTTVEDADHISICRPTTKTTRSFQKLKRFLADIDGNVKEEAKVFEEKRAKEEAKASHQCQGLPDHPVELETRAEDVMKKLRGGGVLGIFGMGGIGKTTLAKQVFNTISRDFEYTCFVDHVKGISHHQLEDWLLNHFHRNGMKLDKTQWSTVKVTKILIVMDDIDSEEQLRCLPTFQQFGKGSCLMMTSRDKEVFKFYEDCNVHEIDFLEQKDSQKLFCKYAFGSKEIPNLLQDSIEKVVSKCGGLPLTLEVMGRYLRGHTTDAKVWEQTIDKLGQAQSITGGQNDRVWASLKVSYNCLAKEEQDMFIEAATIFFGRPLDEALAGWSSITRNAETTWRNLVNRSLVKEIDNFYSGIFPDVLGYRSRSKYVWLHEQLRDLAKNTVNGTRALRDNEAANLLVHQINRNMVEVQPISLELSYRSYDNRRILQLDKLAEMKRLTYMYLYGVICGGRGKGLPSHLSIFRYHGDYLGRHRPLIRRMLCFTPKPEEQRLPAFTISLREMKNLAMLDLSSFVVPKKFPEALGNLTNLRILHLEFLEGLDRLPENFGNLSLLKKLEVYGLTSLKLPKSLGNLKALEYLGLEEIKSLQFPESLEDLPSLVTLSIVRCYELAGLPEYLGRRLTSLKDLLIEGCPLIKYLPESVSQLSRLRRLYILECIRMEALPTSLGHLTSLKDLVIQKCPSIKYLPESFYLLKSLRELKLNCKKLERLPERLGELALLEVLDLAVNNVKALPESVGNLASLRELTFKSQKAKLLPESLGQLCSLKALTLDADSLKRLPDSLGRLQSLRTLTLKVCSVTRVSRSPPPERFSSDVSSCTSLQLSGCEELGLFSDEDSDGHAKTNLFENLSSFAYKLVLEDTRWFDRRNDKTELPAGLGSLTSLRDLTLEDFQSIKNLPEELGELRSLERLTIEWCESLKSLPESLGRISSLREVSLIRCRRLKSLPHSLGKPSSPGNTAGSNNCTRQEEESSQTEGMEGMQLYIFNCKFLDDTVLESLGWTLMSPGASGRSYKRKQTH